MVINKKKNLASILTGIVMFVIMTALIWLFSENPEKVFVPENLPLFGGIALLIAIISFVTRKVK